MGPVPDLICAWCSHPVTTPDFAVDQGRNLVWHVECFVKYLAHKDEIRGIKR